MLNLHQGQFADWEAAWELIVMVMIYVQVQITPLLRMEIILSNGLTLV